MKIIFLFFIFLLSVLGYSQCDNGTNYYPSSIYTPTIGTWGYASTCNWAGEVIQVNITSGDTYQFSTCAGNGGVQASYDTQITLRDGSGALLAYNDDFAGCSGFTSYLDWVATYTGVLYVHLSEYYCASNFVCTQVMIHRKEPVGLPVELLFFNGEKKEELNLIEWATASEYNSDYFLVEHSSDGNEWKQLSEISAMGYSNTYTQYILWDCNVLPITNYYRLSQFDYDGQYEIFEPIAIDNRKNSSRIVKYVDIMGRKINLETTKGIIFEVYEDGSSRKIFKP
tara:strand:+ start:1208 stop:2056 length:849 start_codon:yes stop_codon:yes gene_type:complete